jgi:hypothetical protein
MTRSMRLGQALTIGALTLLSLSATATSARALSLIGLDFNLTLLELAVPVNVGAAQGSPVNVIYRETEEDFDLTVLTNALFDPDDDYKFQITHGKLWNIDLTFTYSNALFEDESVFELTGTAYHNVRPAGDEHRNDRLQGEEFHIDFPSFNLETELTNQKWDHNRIVFEKPGIVDHKRDHHDHYVTNTLTLGRDAGELEELSSYRYHLHGQHVPVHEPSTMNLLGTGIAGLLRSRRRRHR